MIPEKYTADGGNISPPLQWNHGPENVVEYAIIVEDPYEAFNEPHTHWLVYRIKATGDKMQQLPEGAASSAQLIQGKNYLGQNTYAGPKPPKGAVHKYFFQIFALDKPINIGPGATRDQLAKAYEGCVLSQGFLMGTYPAEKK